VVGGSLLLYALRASQVGGGAGFDAISRESLLLANNILLVVACASVLLGTLYPLVIDALGVGKISVGPPYFDSVFLALTAPLAFLVAIGPMAAWKRAELPDLWTRLRWALAVAIVAAGILPFVLGHWSPLIAVGVFLSLWIAGGTIALVVSRFRRAPQRGLGAKLAANPPGWYGMVIAHFGVAVFVLGVTMVKGYGVEQNVTMDKDQTVSVGGYDFTFRGVVPVNGPNYSGVAGIVEMKRGGQLLRTLHPEKRIFNASGTTMTEAAIDSGFFGDRYVSLGEPVSDKGVEGAWAMRVYLKPFVDWIWFGCFIMALGGFVAMSDRRYRLAVRQKITSMVATAAS
jgi:cytochrome c-type biogenesis protein CcmF